MKNKKKIVLGINWEQNSSVALMINGEIKEAVAEERFSRLKNDERYPKLSIEYLLDQHNKEIDEIDYITISWKPR